MSNTKKLILSRLSNTKGLDRFKDLETLEILSSNMDRL